MKYHPGDQILYIPGGVLENPTHERAEQGFVTSTNPRKGIVFCRFFFRDNPDEIRTKTSSEGVHDPDASLILQNHHDQAEIDAFIKENYSDD